MTPKQENNSSIVNQMYTHISSGFLSACKGFGVRQCEICLGDTDNLYSTFHDVQARDHGLCQPCYNQLPHNHFGCSQCALPLNDYTVSRCPECLNRARLATTIATAATTTTRTSPQPLDYAHCGFLYQPPIDAWLRRYKDQQRFQLGYQLAQLMISQPPFCLSADYSGQSVDGLVYLPSRFSRLLLRSFNPAELIAAYLSRHYQLPLIHHSLIKSPGADQRRLSGRQRRQHWRNQYQPNPEFLAQQKLAGQHLLLIDDVITTGASANSAAYWLKKQGATMVGCWALARTPAPEFSY